MKGYTFYTCCHEKGTKTNMWMTTKRKDTKCDIVLSICSVEIFVPSLTCGPGYSFFATETYSFTTK